MKQILRRVLLAGLAVLLVGTAGCGLSEPEQDYSEPPQELSVGSPYKYHYARLEPVEQHAYNAVLSAIGEFPQEIKVPVLTQEQLHNFYTALLYDNPALFYLGSSPTVRQSKKSAVFCPQYLMNAADYASMLRKCDAAADTILTLAEEKETDFEKERVVHDLLIAQCSYSESDNNPYKSSVYGVLSAGSAACEGYAKTAKYLLDRLSIPCYVVVGNSTPPGSRTQAHMWNIVQIGGEWYHLDLTWDDPVLEKGGDVISYSYFNVTDSQLRATHTDYESENACTATEQNFFVHERLAFVDFGAAEKARTVEIAVQMLELGSDGFQLKFGSQSGFEKAQTVLFEDEGIYELLQKIREASGAEFATDRVSYFCTESNRTIDIILER